MLTLLVGPNIIITLSTVNTNHAIKDIAGHQDMPGSKICMDYVDRPAPL